MSSSPQSFIELAAKGLVSLTEIDDFVDRWHEDDAGRQLNAFLGLTPAEYALWLVDPGMLGTIVQARATRTPLPELVDETITRRRAAKTSTDAGNTERLDRWLADQKAFG